MTNLEEYYNKFNEEKRLLRRHGQVEYITTMKYIHKYLEGKPGASILDVGAGTGRYSVALSEEGYDVTAVELVKHNLGILKSKGSNVKAYQGNATKLKRFSDNSFDMTLVFGPMYHLLTFEERLKALNEAKRVTKPGGNILVAYCMNEYGVISYGFKENNAAQCRADGRLNEEFHCVPQEGDLYQYLRLEDIDELNQAAGLTRVQIISADGPTEYMRPVINAMDEETFNLYVEYHLSTCERPELVGAGAHTVDVLIKE